MVLSNRPLNLDCRSGLFKEFSIPGLPRKWAFGRMSRVKAPNFTWRPLGLVLINMAESIDPSKERAGEILLMGHLLSKFSDKQFYMEFLLKTFFILWLFLMLSLAVGCSSLQHAQRSLSADYDIPFVLKDYYLKMESSDSRKKNETTMALAMQTCPSLIDNLSGGSSAEMQLLLNHLASDLDGDNYNEHILVFWNGSDFSSVLVIMKKESEGWTVIHSELIQKHSYNYPNLWVLNDESQYKKVVFSYTSIAHASGIMEKRYRMLVIKGGRVHTVLGIPHHFHNYCLGLDIWLDSVGDSDLRLTLSYSYYDSHLNVELLSGYNHVFLNWNGSDNSYSECFSDGSGLSREQYHYLIEKRLIEDLDFNEVWKDKLNEVSHNNWKIWKP